METDSPHHQWHREQLARKCMDNLKKNGFDAHLAPDIPAARDLTLRLVRETAPGGAGSVGAGGSDTVRQLGVLEILEADGWTLHDHWRGGYNPDQDMAVRRAQLTADCFLCGANAVSITGEIVNVDGIGNRTAAMSFGPGRVIIVAGINKLRPDLPSALARVREVAGPMRAKSLNMKTPCAETGFCADCHSPQRICRITAILHRKPMKTAVSVILIDLPLGY